MWYQEAAECNLDFIFVGSVTPKQIKNIFYKRLNK
jgi:hypothetical protein